jgi:thiol:disulfide interchange protein DsbD
LRLIAFVLVALSLLFATAAAAQPAVTPVPTAGPQSTVRIEAELVPMSAWVAPGSTAIVAIRQQIEPGWHTYWRNPGDSGGPTTLTWTLPVGVTAGDILWPVPERQRLADLMNYGYSDRVFLPVPIEVPSDARPGTILPLVVKALFLVCSDEMCVPDELTLKLDLPVRADAAPLDPRWGADIQTVVETAPRPAGIEARATLTGQTLTLTATGGPLAGMTSDRAWFFPFDTGAIQHAAPQPGERGPDGVTLNLEIGGGMRAGGLTGPVGGVLVTDTGAWEISAEPGPPLSGASGGGALDLSESAAGAPAVDWAVFAQAALFALIGGLILNLMPCVFPVLAMKAASLARAAHEPAKARRDGLAFTGGVLVTFLVLAGVLLGLRAAGEAVGWGFQLQSPPVTAGLALLMLAVALNLSGVFQIGAGLQSAAGSGPLSRLPGGVGAFFTGVLAVVVAAPCTAPFMAFALGAALLMPAPLALIVFLMLGLGLALPYLAVSLSPGLLARLPRPGAWMDWLKGVLAFPMYGAALWLGWVFLNQTGADALGLLFGAALALALAAWLFGQGQAAMAVGRGGWIATGIATLAMLGSAGLSVLAVQAPRVEAGTAENTTALASEPWSPEAVAAANAEGRTVLVNFTADWCVTCKINERAALSSPRVAEALAEANAVYLVGDWTRRDDAIAGELERRGRSGVPLYLVHRPGETEPQVLPQLLTEGVVLDALGGGS